MAANLADLYYQLIWVSRRN